MVDKSQIKAAGGRSFKHPCGAGVIDVCGPNDVAAWDDLAGTIMNGLDQVQANVVPNTITPPPLGNFDELVQWQNDPENVDAWREFSSSRAGKLYERAAISMSDYATRERPGDFVLFRSEWENYVNWVARTWTPSALGVVEDYNEQRPVAAGAVQLDAVEVAQQADPPGPIEKLLQYGIVAGVIYLIVRTSDR